MEDSGQPTSRVCRFKYMSAGERQSLIARRAVQLTYSKPYIGIDSNGNYVVIKDALAKNEKDEIKPLEDLIGKELAIAELELSLGALDHFEILRAQGEPKPFCVFVRDLKLKRQY